MTHDWLLVETLGTEPAVVAQGRRTKNLIPISAFLRRSPNLMAIQTAITETVRNGESMNTITPRNDRVIRTEPVQMSDGRMHGVQVWIGPPDVEPPERLVPGPVKWDLTAGVATDTVESLVNSGRDPSTQATQGRTFAEDLPLRELKPSESKVLSMVIKSEPGMTLCNTWDLTDYHGETISVGFVVRANLEPQEDGSERLICRAMNWRAEQEGASLPPDHLAQRILDGLAQPGVHRALVDPANWTCSSGSTSRPRSSTGIQESPASPTSTRPTPSTWQEWQSNSATERPAVCCVCGSNDGGWTPVHMTINRIEIEEETFAALLALRLPTEEELAVVEFDKGADGDDAPPSPKKPRKTKLRKSKSSKPD